MSKKISIISIRLIFCIALFGNVFAGKFSTFLKKVWKPLTGVAIFSGLATLIGYKIYKDSKTIKQLREQTEKYDGIQKTLRETFTKIVLEENIDQSKRYIKNFKIMLGFQENSKREDSNDMNEGYEPQSSGSLIGKSL